MAQTEREAVAAKRGKWSQAGIPHRGWTCDGWEDLGKPDAVCEMCESTTIRYAHEMSHPDYIGTLLVGRVCAGNMEENVDRARRREASHKSRALKRQKWTTRRWKIAKRSGRNYLNVDGFRVTILCNSTSWGATIADIKRDEVVARIRGCPTESAAKLAAFDRITELLSERGG